MTLPKVMDLHSCSAINFVLQPQTALVALASDLNNTLHWFWEGWGRVGCMRECACISPNSMSLLEEEQKACMQWKNPKHVYKNPRTLKEGHDPDFVNFHVHYEYVGTENFLFIFC